MDSEEEEEEEVLKRKVKSLLVFKEFTGIQKARIITGSTVVCCEKLRGYWP